MTDVRRHLLATLLPSLLSAILAGSATPLWADTLPTDADQPSPDSSSATPAVDATATPAPAASTPVDPAVTAPAPTSVAAPAPVATPTPAAAPAPVAVDAASPLPTGSQNYHLSWSGQLEGNATRTLTCTGGNCTYQTNGSVPGGIAMLRETSQFQWQNGQVHFQRYERNLQFLFFAQQLTIERQPDGSIRTQRKGVERNYAGRDDLVDLLSLELQLRADLLAHRPLRDSYGVADAKGITEIHLNHLPDETLTIAGVKHKTQVYERQDGDVDTKLWLDPKMKWLPLQIVHRDGQDTYQMVWQGAGQ